MRVGRLLCVRECRRTFTKKSSTSAFTAMIDSIYPLIPKFLTDYKLDEAHELEVRRLDDFHSVAGLMDRKAKKSIYPKDYLVRLRHRGEHEDLSYHEFAEFLNSIIDETIVKRENAEIIIDRFAEGLVQGSNNDEELDVKTLLCVTLRLRLLEEFCKVLLQTFPKKDDLESLLAQWSGIVTDLRVKHGVVVSMPALLHRTGLTSNKPPEEDSCIRIDKHKLIGVLHACLYGGYQERILATSHYFSSCLVHEDGEIDEVDTENSEKAVEWPQMEAVLRLVAETSALTLRDELVTFVGFNENHPSVLRSLAQIEQTDIIKQLNDKDDVAEGKTTEESMAITATDSMEVSLAQSNEWSAVFPGGQKERKHIRTHARIWLLHDFDHLQKWRCSFAWADKMTATVSQERNRLDFFGTALLDGAVSAEGVVASQKLNFAELGAFSQHFTAAYKTKRMEAYTTTKGNRETVRTGTIFVIAMALLDEWIIHK